MVGVSGIDPDLERLSAAKGLIRPSRALHLRPNWSEWLDLNQRSLRSERSGNSRLSYTPYLAICTGLEPVSRP